MAKKEQFVVECVSLSAPKWVKDGKVLLNSWTDHVVGKTINCLISELVVSLKKQMSDKTDLELRAHAVKIVHFILDRNIQRIKDGVYTHRLTCAQQK